jgi:hypothetical protein
MDLKNKMIKGVQNIPPPSYLGEGHATEEISLKFNLK